MYIQVQSNCMKNNEKKTFLVENKMESKYL